MFILNKALQPAVPEPASSTRSVGSIFTAPLKLSLSRASSPLRHSSPGNRLQGLDYPGYLSASGLDLIPHLDHVGGNIDLFAVDGKMVMPDQLLGFGTGIGETHAEDHVVQSSLQKNQQIGSCNPRSGRPFQNNRGTAFPEGCTSCAISARARNCTQQSVGFRLIWPVSRGVFPAFGRRISL